MIPKPHRASIVFYVADIARTEKFYTETLGIELTRMEGAEPYWLQGELDQGLSVIFFEMEAERGSTPALVFELPDGGIDDVVAGLVAQGVTIVTPGQRGAGRLERRLSGPGWLWPRPVVARRQAAIAESLTPSGCDSGTLCGRPPSA